MEFELIFCTDGILRIKFGNKPMIPAKFVHDYNSSKSDFSFWTRWWESYTYFEEGLTVSQFLSCLEPWADFWQDLTHKNIKSFIDESKKPLLVKNDNENLLTWISLSYHTEIELETKYESKELLKDLDKWFNEPHNAKLTGEWNIYSSYKLTGYSSAKQEQYSVEHSPMNELANLPLILNKRQILTASDFSAKRILGKDYQLFPKDTFGVRVISHESSDYKTTYLQGDKEHRLREVIEGFFWWFPSNPVSRDEFNESLRMSIDDIDTISKNEDEKESNVISLFKDKESSIASENNNDTTKLNDDIKSDKKLTVKVSPNAFSSITKQIDKNVQFWNELLEKAKDSDVVIKIGKLKEATPLENRVYAYIVPDKDISTPFKEV